MKTRITGILLISSLSFGSIAYAQSKIDVPSQDWVEVQNRNGVIVSFRETLQDGIKYLNIQFTNQSNEQQLISWSLSKGEKIIVRNRAHTIAPNTTIEFFGASMLIPIGASENIGDFKLLINKSIHTQI